MKLKDIEIEKILPVFMRNHADDVAFARKLDPLIRYIGEQIEWCSVWDAIDKMSENFLDNLARELDIDWYDYSADIASKRELIRNSDLVHRKIGTKAAVETTAQDYFGDVVVREWYEYTGGLPYHYIIEAAVSAIVDRDAFIAQLMKVTRFSAVLDDVQYGAMHEATVHVVQSRASARKFQDIRMEGIE